MRGQMGEQRGGTESERSERKDTEDEHMSEANRRRGSVFLWDSEKSKIL